MKKKSNMKYAIKYSDGCYYSRQPENDIDIVTNVADADTFANESTSNSDCQK